MRRWQPGGERRGLRNTYVLMTAVAAILVIVTFRRDVPLWPVLVLAILAANGFLLISLSRRQKRHNTIRRVDNRGRNRW